MSNLSYALGYTSGEEGISLHELDVLPVLFIDDSSLVFVKPYVGEEGISLHELDVLPVLFIDDSSLVFVKPYVGSVPIAFVSVMLSSVGSFIVPMEAICLPVPPLLPVLLVVHVLPSTGLTVCPHSQCSRGC
ncbi:hypothetical protein ROHU_007561 [Labeo rohita]|uniref:Uncharacterized protein n=1 Tax=Labeo rohita TaxID=84645 RepID=A0A498MPH2_LABRO|nr:hypothetical protein ROHU_007561 [Labeo rohita]